MSFWIFFDIEKTYKQREHFGILKCISEIGFKDNVFSIFLYDRYFKFNVTVLQSRTYNIEGCH